MSNMKVTDKRRSGLVEIYTEGSNVVLQLLPPGAPPVVLPMLPALARDMARGLLDGADAAEETPGA